MKSPLILHDENAAHIANTLAKIGSIIMLIVGFLAIFGINFLFLSNRQSKNFVFLLLIFLLGGLILAIEYDWKELPLQYKLPFKSHKTRGIIYVVIGLFCLLEGIGPLLVVFSGLIYYAYDTQNRDYIRKIL